MKRVFWYPTYVLLQLLSWFVNFLPFTIADKLARMVGTFMFYLMPGRRRVARNNLTIAFGDTISAQEKRRLTMCAFRHMAVSLMETFRIKRMIQGDIEQMFDIQGLEHFDSALAKKKGMIFVVSHIGSWEYLSLLFYLTNHECSVLIKKVRNPYIFKWLEDMRLATTMRLISKESGSGAIKEILGQLSKNSIVAILMDQWAGNDEPWIDFFGRPASTTTIPARLALKTGCALVAGSCIRTKSGKYKIQLYPEIAVDQEREDASTLTQRLNRLLEGQIREYPEQWIWTHKRWKDKKIYAR